MNKLVSSRALPDLENLSRRGVLMGLGGGLVLAVGLKGRAFADDPPKYGADGDDNGWRDDPRLFIAIGEDGQVTLTTHRQEMGQGIKTSLALVLADELEADFARVKVVQADGDEAKYGNQDTDGSRSMRHYFGPMRRAGAAARTMLEQAAATKWGVPAIEVRAENHAVVHSPTGRRLGYGELAKAAAQYPIPARESLKLKSPAAFRYVGKDVISGVDRADIVTGKAVYGGDVRPEGCVYAVVARPPVVGGTVASYDAAETMKVPGVLKVVTIAPPREGPPFQPLGGVAVVAKNTWAAIKGRKALKVTWNDGANATYESKAFRSELEASARKPGKVIRDVGDIDKGLAGAAKRVTAEYYLPHLAHASMETPTATVRARPGGGWEAWAPVQAPQVTREVVAFALGGKAEDITVHVTLLGGAFGRKSKPDFVVEAALLSKAMDGAPVKVTWTREDDIQHDYYHTVSLERLEAGLDAKGKVAAWRHRTCASTISSTFGPDPKQESDDELGMGATNLPLDIPVMRLENPQAASHARIGWFRSVSNVPHAFAVQSFIAELAHETGRDPKDFLLEVIGAPRKVDPKGLNDTFNYGEDPALYPIDTGRLRAVIERAAKEIGWGRTLPKGRGLGIAGHYSFVTYTACAMEVEVAPDGTLQVIRADVAVDCGAVVNPDRVRSQAEGSVIMGVSLAQGGEVSFKDGRAQQGNFDSFPVTRIDGAPKDIRVHILGGSFDQPLGGVGEPCLPPVAPALTNAIFAATGKRIRDLPIGPKIKV
ncbi:xanthine dehydrogenase family protein molybdopterin-binding subunit [Phenylobacterium montanum]|uniref:Xanthine dehydrogenase family protein molybdopterin-binding subunit n=1 Tax=Phenylobacterium montanum TaxID=2823693 RepID=A0A975G0G1_9CAUL|nr:molybdopterin cofactor-binding domain-containing protein [Caulobacter sp. S6]QUD88843.1 xanthine dehydrogenase family protein molybdopterin-binding subunit [Caulobacter sp. S6]